MEELEALKRCLAGDPDAFRILVEKYGDLITRSAYLMTHDAGLAEDLAQEVFLAAWRGLGTFDAKRPFRPWLMRILVNRWLNHRRRHLPPAAGLDEVAPCDLAGEGPSPEKVAMLRETQRAVRQAIAALDESRRLALVLRYFAGLSVPEIASVLSCPEGTVKSRLHRALAELRVRLCIEGTSPANGVLHGAESGEQR